MQRGQDIRHRQQGLPCSSCAQPFAITCWDNVTTHESTDVVFFFPLSVRFARISFFAYKNGDVSMSREKAPPQNGGQLRQRKGDGSAQQNGHVSSQNGVSKPARPSATPLVGQRQRTRTNSFAKTISRNSKFRWFMRHQLELSLSVVVLILSLNALNRPEYVLSTYRTPAPSYHVKSVINRFIYLSFKVPGTDNHYFKGRE